MAESGTPDDAGASAFVLGDGSPKHDARAVAPACEQRGRPHANIVIVHNDAGFVAALRISGHDVAAFADPLAAWDAVAGPRTVDVLITGIEFHAGRSNGVALANLAHRRHREIRVMFAAAADLKVHAEGLGTFVVTPAAMPEILEAIDRMATSPPVRRP